MSRTTRFTINLALAHALTHPQGTGMMAGAATTMSGHGGVMGAVGAVDLSSSQDAMATGAAMGTGAAIPTHPAMAATGAMTGTEGMSGADLRLIEQRALIADTTRATLERHGWTVTVVDGGGADRYTGIEATRGEEHLVAAVGADDLIADQAGAHDCGGTIDALMGGLTQIGAAATVVDDVPHDGHGGSLYALDGGPTKAHAIAATLRRKPAPARGRAQEQASLRSTAGGR